MSKCSNCGAELDAGAKFCMECGTPVPQVKKCVQCGMDLPLKAKFCFGCGAPQEGAPAGAGISMGDKNVIAGDVVGQKVAGDNVQNKIMGNAIYNTIQDDTKRVNSCRVCGKHLTNVNGHTCPGCGYVVCDDHFDIRKNLCLNCIDVKKQDALKQYESALLSFGANGRIDVIERNKLDVLANSLELSKAEILPLEQKFKLQVKVSNLTRTEKMTLEAIQKNYFEGKLEDSFKNIKKLFERYPNEEDVVSWYLRFARVLEPNETIDVIAKMQGEFCESYLSLTCIYLTKNQVSDAEVALNKAKQIWSNKTIVRLIETLFLVKLYQHTDKIGFLEEAKDILLKIAPTDDAYESFLLKNERIILACICGDKSEWNSFEKVFCKLFDVCLVVASNKEHLIQLIDDAIDENGSNCDLNFIDVSNVTDMSGVFEESQFNGDISMWDVSNVKNMSGMFCCSWFNGNISKWDVSNVTNMSKMFKGSSFNGDISKWDVSNVTNMSEMFEDSSFDGNVSKWNVSNVTNMSGMFSGGVLEKNPFNGDISKWNVSKVTNMSEMFKASKFEGDVSKWDVSNVTDMSGMFSAGDWDTIPFNGDISKWNVSKVTNMSEMFCKSSFNGDISKWDVSKVTNMSEMFEDSKFNGNISKWNVSNVTDMRGMFSSHWGVNPFEGDISKWNVSKVTNMSQMFYSSSFNGDVSKWNVSNVIDMSWMFRDSQFNGDISQWNVSNVIDMSCMFWNSQFNGDISQWNVSNKTDMSSMFYDCILKKERKLPGWYKE